MLPHGIVTATQVIARMGQCQEMNEQRMAAMISFLETLRETFTLYLAAGLMLSAASVWAAMKAMRSSDQRKSG